MSTAIERISIDAPYGSDVVADARPAIGWVTRSEADGWRQARAELELRLGDGVQTHVVEGRDSVRVPWPFAPLAPRPRAASSAVLRTSLRNVPSEGDAAAPSENGRARAGAGRRCHRLEAGAAAGAGSQETDAA